MSASSRLRLALAAPLRLVRRRGFGVHSPFAYSFITGVLHGTYHFYAHKRVRRLAHGSHALASLLMLTFRIAARFDVRRAAAFGPGKERFDATLRLTRSDMELDSATPQLVVADGDAPRLREAVAATIAAGGTVVLARLRSTRSATAPLWSEAVRQLDSAGAGMTFTNGRTGIIVALRHLPRQDFKVWL